jgi:segregation and condensation protein A
VPSAETNEEDSGQDSARAGGYSVTLPSFEGPLDLLLHLCQKHELDILDIPIGFVTEKYLEYLAVMTLLDLDLASEYLVMAATLAHIKSKMLLPAPPPGQEDDALAEDEEDPREALIRRLLEYQKYKQAGADLQARGVVGRDIFFRGSALEEAVHTGLPPLAQVPLFSLVEAFQGVLAKSKIKLSHDVVHERITLTDRINELVDVLRVRRRLQFEELFNDLSTKFDLVITFLALLEMTKLRMTRLVQMDPLAPIYVEFSAQVNSDDALDENATAEERAAAQAHADAEADAAAEAHAREHAHEPHAPHAAPAPHAPVSPAFAPDASERVTEPEMVALPDPEPEPAEPDAEMAPEMAPEIGEEAVTSETPDAADEANGAGGDEGDT